MGLLWKLYEYGDVHVMHLAINNHLSESQTCVLFYMVALHRFDCNWKIQCMIYICIPFLKDNIWPASLEPLHFAFAKHKGQDQLSSSQSNHRPCFRRLFTYLCRLKKWFSKSLWFICLPWWFIDRGFWCESNNQLNVFTSETDGKVGQVKLVQAPPPLPSNSLLTFPMR